MQRLVNRLYPFSCAWPKEWRQLKIFCRVIEETSRKCTEGITVESLAQGAICVIEVAAVGGIREMGGMFPPDVSSAERSRR
jgi:hypothetical protein